ncbi:MAG: hypothetical protein K2Q10_14020, partial [Rhodospirillales bacterium]|nr:hypothetical protein [Rhodospirillales bacterium]
MNTRHGRGAEPEGGSGKPPLIERLLPEHQILVRTGGQCRCFRLTTLRQVALLAVLAAVLGGNAVAAGIYAQRGAVIAGLERRIARDDIEMERLKDESGVVVARLKEEYGGAFTRLKEEYGGAFARLKEDYGTAFAHLDQVQVAFNGIGEEIGGIQANLLAMAERNLAASKQAYAGGNTPPASKVAAKAAAEPQAVVPAPADQDLLRQRVQHLEAALISLKDSHAEFLRHSAALAAGRIGQIENTLNNVGIDPRELLSQSPAGRGGPYIPPQSGKPGDGAWNASLASLNTNFQRLDSLNQVMRVPPLGAPLDEFDIASPFGIRNDPINQLA